MCGTDVKENNITTADENLPKSIMCSIAHLKVHCRYKLQLYLHWNWYLLFKR